ncbi:MAG: hypothetical protein IJS67_00205 [Clostridia bacterium]|nr:hypothetical protein [Clostridia bacterium]
MIKKLKFLLWLCLLVCVSVFAASCGETELDRLSGEGYKVKVIYDDNGGNFFGEKEDTLIVDMINPEKFGTKDGDKTYIKLIDPLSPERKKSGLSTLYVVKSYNSLAGWYKTRTPVTVNGEVVDEEGRTLTLKDDGTYYYIDGEEEKAAEPKYTYSDRWDFDSDKLVYTGEEITLTLYAGWIPYYEFDYYYEKDGEWVKMDESTLFSYSEVNAEGSAVSDHDEVWLPVWNNGAMNYTHTYANSAKYKFPKIDGMTFNSAYTDEDCTQPIEGYIKHGGTLDLAHAAAINPVQNIYVKYDEGERYIISTAEQFVEYADENGWYTVQNDLDFADAGWSGALTAENFKGKIIAEGGNTYKFSNIYAEVYSYSAEYAGLFGRIDASAEIKGIEFENITLRIKEGVLSDETVYGVFAGDTDGGADLDIKVSGSATLEIEYGGQANREYTINLFAGGDLTKIDNSIAKYSLVIIGRPAYEGYEYTVNKDEVSVDEELNVHLSVYPWVDETLEESEYVIFVKNI